MSREELMMFLQEQQEKDILLELQGVIITNMIINQMQVKEEKNKLLLENKENIAVKIGFNLSQLMKITKTKENEIVLEFDPLQKVIITIQNKIKKLLTEKKIAKNFLRYQQYFGISQNIKNDSF